MFVSFFVSMLVYSVIMFQVLANLDHDVSYDIPPATVTEINLDAYLGRWYQMYSSFLPNQTFEKDGYCITADYSPISATQFNLTNTQAVGSPTGTLSSASGVSKLKNPSALGKWVVTFDDGPEIFGRDIVGQYWIIDLGPLDSNGLYSYSVVSSPLGVTLFILARDVATFRAIYEQELIPKLISEGFATKFNTPLPTYQESDCVYATIS